MNDKLSLSPEVLSLNALVIIVLTCFACWACTDSSPVAPAPDPCCRLVDSLQARVDSLEYQLCVLTLVNNERRRQISCVSDWFIAHAQPWPSACDGRPIDLTQCFPDSSPDTGTDTGTDTPSDIDPENHPGGVL